MATEIATLMIPLHVRAPVPGEAAMFQFVGIDGTGVQCVEVTITNAGLYIATDTGPTLAISLKGLCNAALKAAGTPSRAGAA